MSKTLYKKQTGKVIVGVCAGIGDYMGINANVVRGAFAFSLLFWGLPIILYIVLAVALPQENQRIPYSSSSDVKYPEPTVRTPAYTEQTDPFTQPSYSTHSRSLIDINNASEQELSTLPGLTAIQVKQLIKARELRGGFQSVTEMGDALNLKPHILGQLQPQVQVQSMRRQGSDQPGGRRVDF